MSTRKKISRLFYIFGFAGILSCTLYSEIKIAILTNNIDELKTSNKAMHDALILVSTKNWIITKTEPIFDRHQSSDTIMHYKITVAGQTVGSGESTERISFVIPYWEVGLGRKERDRYTSPATILEGKVINFRPVYPRPTSKSTIDFIEFSVENKTDP